MKWIAIVLGFYCVCNSIALLITLNNKTKHEPHEPKFRPVLHNGDFYRFNKTNGDTSLLIAKRYWQHVDDIQP